MRPGRWRTALAIAALLPPYAAFGVLRHVVSLKTLAAWAWGPARGAAAAGEVAALVNRVVWISRRSGRSDRDCLRRSLLLYHELSRLGAAPELCVSMAPASNGAVGHAWVEIAGRPVLDEDPAGTDHALVVRFGARGQRLTA